MNEIAGFIGVGVLLVIQLVAFAYGYGQINQKVSSIDKRLNDISHRFDKIEERVNKIEVNVAKITPRG